MKKQEITSMDRLMGVMYRMFLDGILPDLDMEDFDVMWRALMERWNIKVKDEEWEAFIKEINCKASERQEFFEKTYKRWIK